MKIVDLFEKTRCKTALHNSCMDKIISTKDISINQLLRGNKFFDKIYISDINDIEKCLEINEEFVLNITTTISNQNVFYSSYRKKSNCEYIDFYLVNIPDKEKEYITSIKIDNHNFFISNFLYLNSFFKAIDDRYVVFIYKESEFGCFDKAILIDSKLKTYYNVHPELYYEDSILKCAPSNIFAAKNKILMKTGCFCSYEKEDNYYKGIGKNNKEQLIVIDHDTFIEDIINERCLRYTLINNKDYKGSLDVIEAKPNHVIYLEVDFVNQFSYIRKHIIKENRSYLLEKENRILRANEIFYKDSSLFEKNDMVIGEIKLQNLLNGETKKYNYEHRLPTLKYIDDKLIVLDFLNESLNDWDVLIYDIEKEKSIDKYENRKATYLEDIDSIILH